MQPALAVVPVGVTGIGPAAAVGVKVQVRHQFVAAAAAGWAAHAAGRVGEGRGVVGLIARCYCSVSVQVPADGVQLVQVPYLDEAVIVRVVVRQGGGGKAGRPGAVAIRVLRPHLHVVLGRCRQAGDGRRRFGAIVCRVRLEDGPIRAGSVVAGTVGGAVAQVVVGDDRGVVGGRVPADRQAGVGGAIGIQGGRGRSSGRRGLGGDAQRHRGRVLHAGDGAAGSGEYRHGPAAAGLPVVHRGDGHRRGGGGSAGGDGQHARARHRVEAGPGLHRNRGIGHGGPSQGGADLGGGTLGDLIIGQGQPDHLGEVGVGDGQGNRIDRVLCVPGSHLARQDNLLFRRVYRRRCPNR